MQSSTLWVYIKALKTGQWAEFILDDKIIHVDMENKEYTLNVKTEDKYKSIIEKKYEPNVYEIDNFFKRYESYNMKKRFKTALESLHSNRKLLSGINSFFFNLFIPKKQAEAFFKQAKDEAGRKNERNLYYHNANIKYQSFVKEHISGHIEDIYAIQKKVSEYLDSIGYKQNANVTDIFF